MQLTVSDACKPHCFKGHEQAMKPQQGGGPPISDKCPGPTSGARRFSQSPAAAPVNITPQGEGAPRRQRAGPTPASTTPWSLPVGNRWTDEHPCVCVCVCGLRLRVWPVPVCLRVYVCVCVACICV